MSQTTNVMETYSKSRRVIVFPMMSSRTTSSTVQVPSYEKMSRRCSHKRTSLSSVKTCSTPCSPDTASPHNTGRPIKMASAPNAIASIRKINGNNIAQPLRISVPLLIPPSKYTGTDFATASTILKTKKEKSGRISTGGSISIVAGTVSSWRAPWLLTIIPSTPASTANMASSAACTPLTTISRCVMLWKMNRRRREMNCYLEPGDIFPAQRGILNDQINSQYQQN